MHLLRRKLHGRSLPFFELGLLMVLKSALLDELQSVVRRKGMARNTGTTYRDWCAQYLLWLKAEAGKWVNPRDVREPELTAYLNFLANTRNVSPNTQNNALQSILFLYREVLHINLVNIDAIRAKRPKKLPTVLSVDEVVTLLSSLHGQPKLIGQLLYGCGLRISEAINLRVKDVDFGNRQLMIRGAKGGKDRVVPLPKAVDQPLKDQIERTRRLHEKDVVDGMNRVELPYRLASMSPTQAGSLAFYWVFCSQSRSQHPEEKWWGRWRIDSSNFGRSLGIAARKSGINKHVHPHVLRHSFATHSLNNGMNIRSLQALLGHADLRTTMIYTHAEQSGVTSEISPLDRLPRTA